MAMVQSKGVRNDLYQKMFVNFDLRNRISRYLLVTLLLFAMSHPQNNDTVFLN